MRNIEIVRGGATIIWFSFPYNMADIDGASEGLQKLEEQLTCALCLGLYQDPKILPCHHAFCSACIQPLVEKAQAQGGALLCPECRRESEGLKPLQTAFTINTLKEVYEKLKTERGFVERRESFSLAPTSPEPAKEACGRHRSQSLDLYCSDCKVLVCRDCLLADKQHNEHKYTYVSELAADCRKALGESVAGLHTLGEKLKAAEESVSQVKSQIDQQEATITEKTTEAFKALFEVLEHEKERVLAQLSMIMEQKRIVLDAQEQTLQAAHHELAQEREKLASSVTTSTDEQIVKSWSTTKEKLDALTDTLEMLSLSPLEMADVGGISAISTDAIRKVCKSASLYYVASASKSELSGEGFRAALTNKMAQFEVKLHDINGDVCEIPQEIVVQLKSLRNGLVTNADVTATCDSQDFSRYTVTYTVETSGRYEISVIVNGQHIPQSPFSLRIRKPPHQVWVPCVEISTLERPTGLAVVGERLYVSEFGGDRVSIFNSKLEKIRSITNLPGPSEITVDHKSNVYVCTIADQSLRKFAPDDTLLKTVGGEGKGVNEFKFPNGNCFHNHKLYVCDSENYRIKVYDEDLNVLDIHGKKAMGPKNYDFPCDIDVDSQGMIYLVDGNNHRIQVFSDNWKFQRTIGKKGSGPGELRNPVCINIDHDQIFVTDYENDRISVFSTSGQFLATFGERYLKHPEGLAIDRDGFVYVSHSRKKVLVFC